jgi:hypothetical protein
MIEGRVLFTTSPTAFALFPNSIMPDAVLQSLKRTEMLFFQLKFFKPNVT